MPCPENLTLQSSPALVDSPSPQEKQLLLDGTEGLVEDPEERRKRKNCEYTARYRKKYPGKVKLSDSATAKRLRSKFPERFKKYWADARLREKEIINSDWRIKSAAAAHQRNHMKVWRRGKREALAGRPKPKTCEICGRSDRRIHWDHDHQTMKFRGWICSNCNVALGMVEDSTETLKKLVTYLEQNAIRST